MAAGLPKELKYLQMAGLIIASVIYLAVKGLNFSGSSDTITAKDGEMYFVTRVVDGDTIVISGNEKVRLIGVDTPEKFYSDKLRRDSERSGKDIKAIQALGSRASDFTKRLCLNKRVRLEYDVEKRDRYRRLLAYVYLEDGTFVNAKIIEEGYGQILTVPPNVRHSGYFRKLENDARDAKRGLWKYY